MCSSTFNSSPIPKKDFPRKKLGSNLRKVRKLQKITRGAYCDFDVDSANMSGRRFRCSLQRRRDGLARKEHSQRSANLDRREFRVVSRQREQISNVQVRRYDSQASVFFPGR